MQKVTSQSIVQVHSGGNVLGSVVVNSDTIVSENLSTCWKYTLKKLIIDMGLLGNNSKDINSSH